MPFVCQTDSENSQIRSEWNNQLSTNSQTLFSEQKLRFQHHATRQIKRYKVFLRLQSLGGAAVLSLSSTTRVSYLVLAHCKWIVYYKCVFHCVMRFLAAFVIALERFGEETTPVCRLICKM